MNNTIEEMHEQIKLNYEVQKVTLDVIEYLTRQVSAYNVIYKPTGRQIPSKKWNHETRSYELVLDDDGNQVYENEWGDVPRTEEEYSDDDKRSIKAINIVLEKFTKELCKK